MFEYPDFLMRDCISMIGQCSHLPEDHLIDHIFDLQNVMDNISVHFKRNEAPYMVSLDFHAIDSPEIYGIY